MFKSFNKRNETVANESSAMSGEARSENGLRLLTMKRLIKSRQKKRLFFGTFATVFVVVVSILTFYSCKKM